MEPVTHRIQCQQYFLHNCVAVGQSTVALTNHTSGVVSVNACSGKMDCVHATVPSVWSAKVKSGLLQQSCSCKVKNGEQNAMATQLYCGDNSDSKTAYLRHHKRVVASNGDLQSFDCAAGRFNILHKQLFTLTLARLKSPAQGKP